MCPQIVAYIDNKTYMFRVESYLVCSERQQDTYLIAFIPPPITIPPIPLNPPVSPRKTHSEHKYLSSSITLFPSDLSTVLTTFSVLTFLICDISLWCFYVKLLESLFLRLFASVIIRVLRPDFNEHSHVEALLWAYLNKSVHALIWWQQITVRTAVLAKYGNSALLDQDLRREFGPTNNSVTQHKDRNRFYTVKYTGYRVSHNYPYPKWTLKRRWVVERALAHAFGV